MTMFCVVFTTVFVFVHSANMEKRDLQVMDQTSLNSFRHDFRTALLNKIAHGWNTTVDLTQNLKAKMIKCNATIKHQVALCDACTKNTCHKAPESSKHLTVPDPMLHLKNPMLYFISRFEDCKNLMGTDSTHFTDAMKTSAKVWFIGMAGMAGLWAAGMYGMSSMAYHMMHGMMDGFFNMFGRSLAADPATLACMQSCPPCPPLQLAKPQMISQQTAVAQNKPVMTAICGADLISANKTIAEKVKKMEAVYDAALDTSHPVLSKIEVEPATIHGLPSHVFVTVRLNGQETRYRSLVPYIRTERKQSAQRVAMEYWNKFKAPVV